MERARKAILQGATVAGVVVAATLALLLAPPAGAQEGQPPTVVDPSGVLTAPETEFLANAVLDARERTPYLPSVLVVSDLDGRDPVALAEQLVPAPPDGSDPQVVLVVAQGSPPQVSVVAPSALEDDADVRADLAVAERQAADAASTGGVPQAGLGFTAGLIEGAPEPASRPVWLVWAALLIVCVSAWRTFREWRRSHKVPRELRPIGEADGEVILATGQIRSDEAFTISGTSGLVHYVGNESWTTQRYQQWRGYDGRTWLEEDGQTTHTKTHENSVVFGVQDGTGMAWVNPAGADVHCNQLEKDGGLFSDSSWKLRGLQVGQWITVAGPCHPWSDGNFAFDPKRRSGSDVMVFAKEPKAAYRAIRFRMYKRFAWTGFWLFVLLLVFSIRPA